jgi:hypothetical protein
MTNRQAQGRGQAARDFQTNKRELGGRAATGMDRESSGRGTSRSGARTTINRRVRGNDAQKRT